MNKEKDLENTINKLTSGKHLGHNIIKTSKTPEGADRDKTERRPTMAKKRGGSVMEPETQEGQEGQEQEMKGETPKKEREKVTITCVDCGATRTINKGEEFQVKRCIPCQEKHRKGLRKGYRKNKVQRMRERIVQLEKLLQDNNIGVPA